MAPAVPISDVHRITLGTSRSYRTRANGPRVNATQRDAFFACAQHAAYGKCPRPIRDRLFTEIFPGRGHVPKTLIFAVDDKHAEEIVNMMRTVFGQVNDFCKKSTYKAADPDALIAEFRNSPDLRIAVTVNMIATGADIRPLECVFDWSLEKVVDGVVVWRTEPGITGAMVSGKIGQRGADGTRPLGISMMGAPMDPLQPDDPAQVGGYRLLGRLGAGGMGQVFYGRSPGGRPVAVKVIRADHADSERFRERFAREVEAARRVGGFHTAQVVDADPRADPPWMVTAYVPGPSLHEAVADHGPLRAEVVRELGAGLAEGLAAIHACELVHRDLKPGNVILADDGPRIIDFGIARALDISTMTASGAVLGTYAYMSPEQVRGESVGPAGDVFALGAVLAFAATGRAPFGRGSVATIVHRITTEPPDLDGVPTGHDLRDVIAGCLAKHPADRPALAQVLQHLAGHEPAVGEPPRAGAIMPARGPESSMASVDTIQRGREPSGPPLEDGQRAAGEETGPGEPSSSPVLSARRRSARRRRPLIIAAAPMLATTLTAILLIITEPWSAESDSPPRTPATRTGPPAGGIRDPAAEAELVPVLGGFFAAFGAHDGNALARFSNGPAAITPPRAQLTFVRLARPGVYRTGKTTEAVATVTWQGATSTPFEWQQTYRLKVEKIRSIWYINDLRKA